MSGDDTPRAFVIGRRRTGRPIAETVGDTQVRLERAGWKVESRVVRRKRALRDHTAKAVEDGVDVVVAVGGDGAVLQVVNALAGTKVALGIIPRGTGNLLAGNLGIPNRIDRAVAVIVNGSHRRIDLGRVSVGGKDRHFAVACGVGFDARVMQATRKVDKRRLGKLAYVVQAISQARRLRDEPHRITIDGTRTNRPAAQVLVANFGRVGSLLEPRREIEPDDGKLDVIVVQAPGPVRGLLAGWEALMQSRLGTSAGGRVFRAQAREVRVETGRPRLVETDGSVVGTTPISIVVEPDALTVIVPAK